MGFQKPVLVSLLKPCDSWYISILQKSPTKPRIIKFFTDWHFSLTSWDISLFASPKLSKNWRISNCSFEKIDCQWQFLAWCIRQKQVSSFRVYFCGMQPTEYEQCFLCWPRPAHRLYTVMTSQFLNHFSAWGKFYKFKTSMDQKFIAERVINDLVCSSTLSEMSLF